MLQSGLEARCLEAKELQNRPLHEFSSEEDWLTTFLPQDYYGSSYLLDIALATRYSQATAIGKVVHYRWAGNELKLDSESMAYSYAASLPKRSAAISIKQLGDLTVSHWLADLHEGSYSVPLQLAIDPFNYCREGMVEVTASRQLVGGCSEVLAVVDDLKINTGLSLRALINEAELVEPLKQCSVEFPIYSPIELQKLFGQQGNKHVAFDLTEEGLQIASKLDDGKHEYFYACQDIAREVLMLEQLNEDVLPLYLDMEPGLNLSLVVLFLDENGQRINHSILLPNRNHNLELPWEMTSIRLGWRVYSGGQACIKELMLGHRDLQPVRILSQSDVLLLTNHYPSDGDLYRNGFIHSRVKSYKERGVNVDIFRLRKDEIISWHEFENVDVTTGSQEALRLMLSSGRYRHILVHFLDASMWEVLVEFINHIQVTVWVHGAEIHPWYRRKFNFETPEQEEISRIQSEPRMAFWKNILKPMHYNLKVIFVSKIFADEVMEDLGFDLPETQYEVIHNPIDDELFWYQEKDVGQRRKILSIRPYASRQYANDLSVKVILELSKKSFFKDLEFRLIGDGRLFDETIEPLRKFNNIIIEKKFLTRSEIANLHKEYGIFLCPTRWDSQGVSRDEAMSSGLVPVTNSVAAVIEFVDDHCGILSPTESIKMMVDGIVNLYENPDRFKLMSELAARRVRSQSALNKIIEKELKSFQSLPASIIVPNTVEVTE